jgi:hypothetical protein
MPPCRYGLAIVLGLAFGVFGAASCADATPAPAGVQAGRATQVADSQAHSQQANPVCGVLEQVAIGAAAGGLACKAVPEALGGLAGEAVSAAGNSVMNALAEWMIGAATQVTAFVSKEMQETTTPQLESSWYEAQFQPMADLGAALALLVAMIALASAAIRRSPEALAATLAGIVRAGIGTGLVIPLTVIGLGIADQVSSAVITSSPHTFWATVAHAWGTHGWGGFGSSALATLIALIEVFAAVFVWLELIVRNAAIYVAVLFFAAALAAAIWPVLASWPGRLGRMLFLFVILKPVALIVLSLAGNAAAAGLSFGSGVSGSVGTILAAIVIFALAAFAPWALMYLLAADAESAYMAAGMRTAAGAAVTDSNGRSVRSGGGLRNLSGHGGGSAAGGCPAGGGSPGGGRDSDGGRPGGGLSPAGGPVAGGDGAAGATLDAAGDGALAVGGQTTAAGSIAVAAGAGGEAPTASSQGSRAHAARAAQDASSRGSAREGASGATVGGSQGSPATRASPPGADGGASLPAPARAPVGTSSQDASEPAEDGHPAQPGAPRTPQPPSGGVPQQSPDVARRSPRSPHRRSPRRSPALSGTASRTPRPGRTGDREE